MFPAVLPAALIGLGASYLLARGLFLNYPKPAFEAGALSAKEQAIVGACADAFFPAGGRIPISGTEAGLVKYFDGYLLRLPATEGKLVHLLLWFIEHTPWLLGPRRERFSSLSHEERMAVLASMGSSSIYFRRVAFLSMRTILTMGYLSHPEVCKVMNLTEDLDPFGIGAREANGQVSS